jgi:hypothetical protein
MKTTVLKPGYLVSLKTTIRGGVNYRRRDIEVSHQTDTGAAVSKWETEREIPDPVEFEQATIARSKARSLVTAVCCPSSFGLLCPLADEGRLQESIAAARAVADAHNAGAGISRVEVYVLVGQVARDDQEAARAISSEMRDLMAAMDAGIRRADPGAIREAANKARAMGAMLSEDVAGIVNQAIDQARKAARELVKRVEKAGEPAALVVAELASDRIQAARFSFLDLDERDAVGESAAAARPIDLEPAPVVAPVYAQPSLALEF